MVAGFMYAANHSGWAAANSAWSKDSFTVATRFHVQTPSIPGSLPDAAFNRAVYCSSSLIRFA